MPLHRFSQTFKSAKRSKRIPIPTYCPWPCPTLPRCGGAAPNPNPTQPPQLCLTSCVTTANGCYRLHNARSLTQRFWYFIWIFYWAQQFEGCCLVIYIALPSPTHCTKANMLFMQLVSEHKNYKFPSPSPSPSPKPNPGPGPGPSYALPLLFSSASAALLLSRSPAWWCGVFACKHLTSCSFGKTKTVL